MRETIAAFDFDGTLTKSDTFLTFLLFRFGAWACLKCLWKNKRIITMYVLKQISNHDAKQAIFSYFFQGMALNDFDAACRNFAVDKIPGQIKRKAIEKVEWHLHSGHTVVILSASVRNWIEPWAKNYGIKEIIATEIELEGNTLTGRFSGKNCYGPEKVNRFLSRFPVRGDYQLYAYGDSKGDKDMLDFADFRYFRRF